MSFSIGNVGDCGDLGANLVEARLPLLRDGISLRKIRGEQRQMQGHVVQPAARPHLGRKRDCVASKAGEPTQGQLRIASPRRRTD
jgi:hypothetical protein